MKSDAEIGIADSFLQRILTVVHDLAELKVVLQVVRLAGGREFPVVSRNEMLSGPVVRSVVGLDNPVPSDERLVASLNRAVADGLLLQLDVEGREPLYVPNTDDNARRVRDLPFDVLPTEGEITVHRPNVFALYEQHLGPLTPLLAEQLRDAERMYPRAWIEQAILQAVHYNKRNWRYVQAILAGWEETGAPDGIAR